MTPSSGLLPLLFFLFLCSAQRQQRPTIAVHLLRSPPQLQHPVTTRSPLLPLPYFSLPMFSITVHHPLPSSSLSPPLCSLTHVTIHYLHCVFHSSILLSLLCSPYYFSVFSNHHRRQQHNQGTRLLVQLYLTLGNSFFQHRPSLYGDYIFYLFVHKFCGFILFLSSPISV